MPPYLPSTRIAGFLAASQEKIVKNENIKYKVVRVVDTATNTISNPQPFAPLLESIKEENWNLRHQLAALKRLREDGLRALKKGEELDHLPSETEIEELQAASSTHFIQLVAVPSEKIGKYPLVKIINTKEATQKARESRERHRQSVKKQEEKEIQFTWGVAPRDLEHKLRRAKEYIGKGYRVLLVFAPKPNQRPALSPPEMDTLVNEAVESLADVAREWMPREIKKNIWALRLQDKDRPLSQKLQQALAETEPSSASR
ncbi:hypothetical protein EWM64_g1088 [Hericium alpestre]|uniref:Translation initiation factor 3 N-terminal domain-containing protein n=1 Tax=Hericium alpestre TaxID=135208 RepID=A0A4Z0A9E5_9AGAM|nr:hypothetical protein EWM64_g1088 [Hericium alpestre]